MYVAGGTIRTELNKLIYHHSLGKYSSLNDIRRVNTRLLISRLVVLVAFTVVLSILLIFSPPFLVAIGAFPTTLVLFAEIIDWTAVLCFNCVIIHLLYQGNKTMIEGDYEWLRSVKAELSPTLLKEQHRLCKLLREQGIVCEAWDDNTVIRIGEVDNFVSKYTNQ